MKEKPGNNDKKHWLDDVANVKKVIRIFLVSCAILFLLDAWFLLHHKHLSFEEGMLPIEAWFGFYGIYGFVACVLLVLVAKQLRKVVMRGEDYYDR